MKIFPCEEYIQQHGSNFDVDYKKSASYEHNRYHPSFILINDVSYTDLFEKGDLADTKQFFEGKGKAL